MRTILLTLLKEKGDFFVNIICKQTKIKGMESVIYIKKCSQHVEQLESSDLKSVRIYVESDIHDLLVYNHEKSEMDDTIFQFRIEFGEKNMYMHITINELELFASSVLKQVEIIKNTYRDQLKIQYDMGVDI